MALVVLTLLVWIPAIGTVRQPPVHYFYDASIMRDTATVWTALTWNVRDERHFWPVALLSQHEGLLQWLVMNTYATLVGGFVRLDPRTMQVQNTILTWCAALFAWRLGARLLSAEAGRFAALSLVLMPWLALTLRRPWVFNLLSVATELATFYAYVRFAEDPARPRYRAAAALALGAYMLTGVDWPSFVLVLAVFLVLAGRWREALANRYNIAWLAVFALYAAWAVGVFTYARLYKPQYAHLYHRAILVYPFYKVFVSLPTTDVADTPSMVGRAVYLARTFGTILVLAVAGIAALRGHIARVISYHVAGGPRDVRASAITALAVWMLALVPLAWTPSSITFGYVVAAPMALLAGACVAAVVGRLTHRSAALVTTIVIFLVVSAALQLALTRGIRIGGLTIRGSDWIWGNDDRRVMAAAAFLNEQRPDLLEIGRVALLPRDAPANVGQYARGRNTRLVMPIDFPVTLRLHSAASKLEPLRDFVTAYQERNELHTDWLILASELLDSSQPVASFYRRLRADPRIHWIAELKDHRGRALLLGEVNPRAGGNVPPVVDVDPLADLYARKYDRLSFLRRNVRYVLHE
jgi:hypothetical protein